MPTTISKSHQPKDLVSLRRHLQSLATLPVTDAPVVSAFLNLKSPPSELSRQLTNWSAAARSTLPAGERAAFDQAITDIEFALREAWPTSIRSVAAFAREGETPLLQILPFAAELETSFHVSPLPVIFPLVQMKDRFHRFVVAISTEDHARIFEITLGAISENLLATRPEMRKRIGREWTREHYHQHKRETDRRFLKDQADMISSLMAKRGINHLILAGTPQSITALHTTLPKQLQERVASHVFRTPRSQDYSEVLHQAVQAFIEVEDGESRGTVEMLYDRVRSNGLAVLGVDRCHQAMEMGAAAELVISEELPAADRESLVRQATSLELPIEVCENDELLNQCGGVGCLLRYRPHGL